MKKKAKKAEPESQADENVNTEQPKKSKKKEKSNSESTARKTEEVPTASQCSAGGLFGGTLPGDGLFGGSLPGDELFGGSLPGDADNRELVAKAPVSKKNMRCLKMRGLPFKVTLEEIVEFFSEFKVKADMITLAKKNAKASRTKRDGSVLLPGEALVTFPKAKLATKAQTLHGAKIG